MPKMTVTVDAYQIDIDDRIVGSGSLFGSGGAINSPSVIAAILANGNSLDPTVTQTGINIFTNGLDTSTKGLDVVATYSTDFGAMGKATWSLTANMTDTEITRIAPPPSQLAAGVSLFDRTARAQLETTAPKYRVVGAASWSVGSWVVSPKVSAFGESSLVTSRTGAVYFETVIAPAAIFDLDVTYKFNPKTKLSVGANNLFNYYPDKVNAGLRQEYLSVNSNAYVTQYPTFSPFGINGGYYYAKLAYSF
jgi:iron complex outermembrane recepter protein